MKNTIIYYNFILILILASTYTYNNKSQKTEFLRKYDLAYEHMLKHDDNVRNKIESIGKKILNKNKKFKLIYLPQFKIDNSCFVDQNCQYDKDLDSCLYWYKEYFSYIIQEEETFYYFEIDSTFRKSTFKVLTTLNSFNISTGEGAKSIILREKLFILDSNICFYDDGKIKILNKNFYVPFSQRYDFYNLDKSDTIVVYRGKLNSREQDTTYLINYSKKVHSSVPYSARGCCECLKSKK